MREKPIRFDRWVAITYGPDKDLFYYDQPKMFAPQVDWLKNFDGEICIDMIGRFEALKWDFEKVAVQIGVPHFCLILIGLQRQIIGITTTKKRRILYLIGLGKISRTLVIVIESMKRSALKRKFAKAALSYLERDGLIKIYSHPRSGTHFIEKFVG